MPDPTEEREIDRDLIKGYTEDDIYERAKEAKVELDIKIKLLKDSLES